MQTVTLVIAILGVVLSALALSWQAASFFLTGGRVRVELRVGVASDETGDLAVHPAHKVMADWDRKLPNSRFSRPVVGVQVTNVGRLPVTVSEWSVIDTATKSAFRLGPGTPDTTSPLYRPRFGPTLPHELKPGTTETWAVDYGSVALLRANVQVLTGRKVGAMKAVVVLGDGRSQTTRYAMPEAADPTAG